MKKILLIAVVPLFLLLSCPLFAAEDPGGFKFLYQVKKDEVKILKASLQQDQGKFLSWEKGRIIAKDVYNGSGWSKYMDFSPEDFGIRMEEDNSVRIIEPGMVSGICYSPENKELAFLMHLGDSINSVLAVADMSKDRVIYTNSAKIHPQVAGRRMEFMAIENLNMPPCISGDGKFVAYGAYTYLYANNVEIVSLADKKKTIIKNAVLPYFWKDKLYYLVQDEKKKKSALYCAALLGLKGEKFMDLDMEVNVTCLHKGVYYVLSGTRIFACPLEGDKKFSEAANTAGLGAGYDKSEIQKFFAASNGNKDYLFVFLRGFKGTKIEFKMYAREIK